MDDGIWIVPDWCELEDPEAINIRLVPGLAFGTGGRLKGRCSRLQMPELHALPGGQRVVQPVRDSLGGQVSVLSFRGRGAHMQASSPGQAGE